MSSLLQDYGHDEAEKIFRRALHKGILDERDNCFVVPIPSMQKWLVSNYARIQEKEMLSRSVRVRSRDPRPEFQRGALIRESLLNPWGNPVA